MRIKRVLYISEGDVWPYQDNFAAVPDIIERIGYDVQRVELKSATFDMFQTWIKTFKPDIVFCFLRSSSSIQRMATYLDELHDSITLNWFQEDPNGVNKKVMEASRSFDYWFTINALMVPFWPTKAYLMPPAFDEQVYKDFKLPKDYFVSYIGKLGHPRSTEMLVPYMKELSAYKRNALLALDRPMGVPILPWPLERTFRKAKPFFSKFPIWKCTWMNPSDEREKAEFINRSKIHFGISRVRGYWEEDLKQLLPNYPIGEDGMFCQIKGRVFQGMAAHAMMLNDYIPELEGLFDVGKEIVTFEYGCIEDLREKLKWYAGHDREREEIVDRGYQRVHKEHTFAARITQIIDVIHGDL